MDKDGEKREALRTLIIDAARELSLERETPDDRLMVLGLKKVRAAIRHLDEFENDSASWLEKTEHVKGNSCETPSKSLVGESDED